MSTIVNIHGHAVSRLTYRNQPVLTLPMIDELHDRRKEAAMKAFIANKDMFIEGTDYFDVPYSEWKPLLDCNQLTPQKPKKARLNIRETEVQTGENRDICRNEIPFQTEKTDEWQNMALPLPVSTPPVVQCCAEPVPVKRTKATSTQPRHKQQKLPITVQNKARGGRRGNMYLLAKSGYAMLVKVFTDPHSWAIQRELVDCYFGRPRRNKRTEKQSMTHTTIEIGGVM